MAELHLRRAAKTDRRPAAGLLGKLRVSIGGLSDPSLHQAMCGSPEVCTVVAACGEDEVAGVALVELNRRWLWRRPWLAGRMVLARFLASRRTAAALSGHDNSVERADLPPYVSRSNPPMRWADAGPRVLFIAVDPAWRGRGVGRLLYLRMFDEIRLAGYSHIRARIAIDNTASLRLHHDTGWKLYEDGGVVLAIKELVPGENKA